MNTDKHPEFASPDGDRMDVCSDAADVKTQEEEGEREDSSYSENGMFVEGAIKTEAEEMEDNEQYLKTEKERQIVPKEEAEGASEDGMEDGLDEERTEDEDDEERDGDGDEEGDTLNEPQDLSLVDYSRYDSATLQDAHAAAEAAEGTCVPGDMGPRIQTTGKLNCDICGLSCVSINVLLVHKRSHTGERPFHCSQCGASFTQKGNLLRHIKLHSGEKPFKCPMCSYACRRRDALSGHLRTHSVEKPFKCNHCSRSYKQRSSLEEHRERCHVYIQSKGPAEREDSHTSRTQMGTERALLLDRLASNVAKRKSSMPQKFTGIEGRAVASNLHTSQNGLHCPQFSTRFVSWVDKSFNMRTTGSERSHFCNRRERERENRHVARNVSRCLSVCSSVALCIRGLRLRRLLPLSPLSSSNFCCWLRMLFGPVNVVCSSSWCDNGVCLDLSFNRELVHQTDAKDPPGGSPGPDGQHQQHPILTGPDGDAAPSHRPYPISLSRSDINPLGLTNGHKIGMSLMGHPRNAQPPLCMDSFHNDSSQMSQPVMYSLGHLLGGLNHQNGVPHPHAQPIPLSHPLDALRVARAEGEAGPGAVYPCSHCRVIFLDYVMFTIHMGCHGFRDPLECNVCGHRSQDRYEFSSHIARGEHRLELK